MSDVQAGPEAPPKGMPAEFGLGTAVFVIVASMVGTGVLTTSGFTVLAVGSNELMLWLWVIGGLVAACGALTLCELTAALPKTGGDYVYLHAAYGPLVAFLSGWVSFLIGFAAPSASSAFGAAKYLTAPVGLDPGTAELWQRGIGSVLVLVFALIHVSGRRQTAQVQGWITALKLVLLGLFVIAGVAAGWQNFGRLADRPPLGETPVVPMMFSLVYIAYAYIGWNAASYLAGEFVDPQRQLPRAILAGTFGVMVLYLGLNVVYALALSAGDVQALVKASGDPPNPGVVAPIAEIAARRLFRESVAGPWSVAVGLMLLSSLSAYVLTGPRVIYAMAAAGQFPSVAGRLTRKSGTPAVATVLQTAATLGMLWSGSFDSLIIYAGVGLSIFSMLAISAVYVLRVRRPELPRPFRTPGYPVTPAVFLLGTSVLTGAAFWERPAVSLYALGTILLGVPLFYIWRWLAGPKTNVSPS
ncbi:MAG: amino acid permease [Isosphaeraceae bacterium]